MSLRQAGQTRRLPHPKKLRRKALSSQGQIVIPGRAAVSADRRFASLRLGQRGSG